MMSVSVKAVVLAPIWGVGLLCAGTVAAVLGPDLEESLFPMIADQTVFAFTRAPDRVCWSWTYTKRRNGYLTTESFYLERDDGVRFPVALIRPDLGIPTNDSTTAKAGIRRTIPQCVAVPYVLRDAPRFTIRGAKMYRPWHGLWMLSQPVATVTIDFPATTDGTPHDDAPGPR